jgi:hypothetical protein
MLRRFANSSYRGANAYLYIQAFNELRTKLSSIHDRVPLLADHIKSEARKLLSWAESLNVSIPHVVKDPADQVSSALSTGDPSGWRPVLADTDFVSCLLQGSRSPISLLSADSLA